VVGAIDGSHIPIKAPSKDSVDYFNRKKFYSVVLQAVCDSQYKFLDIYCGWAGATHDSRVLRNSPFYNLFNNNAPSRPPRTYILGDGGYPNNDWLLVPYKDNGHLTQIQTHYNYKHSATRIKIEQAFGLLKSRWRILQNPIDANIEIIPHIVSCCCILHNICEERKELINQVDIISDSGLLSNGVISENNTNNSIQRDLVANDIFSRRHRRMIYQNDSDELEMEMQGKIIINYIC
jgi:hypothetical protein